MRIEGSVTVGVPRRRLWEALMDPAVLARTLPGCERLEATGPDSYRATITAGVASIKGTYLGTVELSDRVEPERYRLRAGGSGTAGTVSADAVVHLDEVEGGTRVRYEAEAVVGGMIGGVGQRMIAGVAKRMAGQFFAAVEADVRGERTPAAAAATGPATAPVAASAPASGVTPGTAGPGPGIPTSGVARRPSDLALAAVLGGALVVVGVVLGSLLT
ncbi:MAG: SRPBCC family protein [Nitriliruptoraceae bacterium]|jgi:carbon monoxide dehydrogenase subunit G